MNPITLSNLSFGIDDTLLAVQDEVRKFCQKEVAPLVETTDKENRFPAQLWKKFGDMGLLGMTVSEEYGGANLGYLAHILVMQ